MKDTSLAKTGAVGAVIAAVCCLTPALIVGIGTVGFSTWLGWLDFVLYPALVVIAGVLAFGLWHLQCSASRCSDDKRSTKDLSSNV